MKLRLLLLMTIIGATTLSGQVSFCPPGAEWHYTIKALNGGHPDYKNVVYNNKASFAGKAVLDGDSVTMLQHDYFFISCGGNSHQTFLKQKGDTIFFRNYYTRDRWQVLFNFAAPVGSSWSNRLLISAMWGDDSVMVNVTVDSIDMVTDHSFQLKRLGLTYAVELVDEWFPASRTYTANVTERFGGQLAIFNFDDLTSGFCDGDEFQRMLCYEDPVFGLKKFSSLPCDYSNLVDIQKIAPVEIRISPNPTQGPLRIEVPVGSKNLQVIDITGSLVIDKDCGFYQQVVLDLSAQPAGVYLIKLITEKGDLIIQKLVLEH